MMNAISFILNYPEMVNHIEKIASLEYKYAIDSMREIDPHDLVQPDSYFSSSSEAMGFVFYLFLKEINK